MTVRHEFPFGPGPYGPPWEPAELEALLPYLSHVRYADWMRRSIRAHRDMASTTLLDLVDTAPGDQALEIASTAAEVFGDLGAPGDELQSLQRSLRPDRVRPSGEPFRAPHYKTTRPPHELDVVQRLRRHWELRDQPSPQAFPIYSDMVRSKFERSTVIAAEREASDA